MTVLKRDVAFAVVALAVVPFAAASATPSKTSSTSQSCSANEFYYEKKDCCLPHGGPTATPTHGSKPPPTPSPPSGKSCPPTNWYWSEPKSCCLPNHPVAPSGPSPICSTGHNWQDATQCCVPSTPSKPTQPAKPSGGAGKSNGGYGKRALSSRTIALCPNGFDACPIPGLTSGDYECLDTTAELESCGGCSSIGEGQDCNAIKGAWNVGCDRGSCKVYSCFGGFKLAADGASCVPL